MGNVEEKKVGVAGLQPNTFLHDYSKIQKKKEARNINALASFFIKINLIFLLKY